jgi:hypothetical protein
MNRHVRKGDRGDDAEGEGLPTGELATGDASQGEGDAPTVSRISLG